MVSKRLMGVWAFLDFLLLAAGAVTVALSMVWRSPNILVNMVFSNADLTAGTVLGIALLVTFAISIAAIVQRNHITMGLVILNWTLIIDAIGIIIVGTFLWFYTLQERNNFHTVFSEQSSEIKIAIQDKLNCCGYFDFNDLIEFGGICSDEQAVAAINQTCVDPITNFADTTLNNVFTTVYGFMAIVLCLFLASLCVIKKREEDERFKKIDAKRGGRGFV